MEGMGNNISSIILSLYTGGEGEFGLFITLTLTFMIMFSYSLAYQLLGLLLNFEWLVY